MEWKLPIISPKKVTSIHTIFFCVLTLTCILTLVLLNPDMLSLQTLYIQISWLFRNQLIWTYTACHLICDFVWMNLVVPKHMNGFLLTRDLLLIPILSILLLSLQWVVKKSKTDFLRYIGYRNFIKDLIKHVLLLILVHVRLLFCPNC